MLFWLSFGGMGLIASVLCIRYAMIEAAMVGELTRRDPTFKPRYPSGSIDPAKRTYNVREYRRRQPDGPLNAKLRFTQWALGAWFVLAVAWLVLGFR